MEKAGNSTLQTLSKLGDIRSSRELNTQEIDELMNIAFRLERSVAIQSELNLSDLAAEMLPSIKMTVENGSFTPNRATAGSAGFDFASNKHVKIKAKTTELIPTGVKLAIPEGYVGLLLSRSGLGVKKGIVIAQGAGTIDSDYRGEIMVPLYNRTNEDYEVPVGTRVAQMIFLPVLCDARVVTDLDGTERGSKGFGSTGTSTDTTKTYDKSKASANPMDIPTTC